MNSLEFGQALQRLITSEDVIAPDERHALGLFVTQHTQRAGELIVALARTSVDDARALSAVRQVIGQIIEDGIAVDAIEAILAADGVIGEQIVYAFAIEYDRKTGGLPRELIARLIGLAWERGDYMDDWQRFVEQLRERDPERTWSTLAAIWTSEPDPHYAEFCCLLTFGTGENGFADWAAQDPWPSTHTSRKATSDQLDTWRWDWRDYFPSDDPRRARAAIEVEWLDLTVRKWLDTGQDPVRWLSRLGRSLPGCGVGSCCQKGLFERELEERGYHLRGNPIRLPQF